MRLNMNTPDFAFLYWYNGQIKLLHQLIQGAEMKRSPFWFCTCVRLLEKTHVWTPGKQLVFSCSYLFLSHYIQSTQCSDQPLVMKNCNGEFPLVSWNIKKRSVWGMSAMLCSLTGQLQMWTYCTGTLCLAEIGRIVLLKQLIKIKAHHI